MTTSRYQFSMIAGRDLPEKGRERLRLLFNEHYGRWGSESSRAGRRICISRSAIADLVDRDEAFVLLAQHGGVLVGYAIGTRVVINERAISWVTQLVVHTDYQRNGIATKLLKSAWRLSDDFAWGLASANPFAIRALEAATLRRCNPEIIAQNVDFMKHALPKIAKYLEAPLNVGNDHARIATGFLVSHDDVASSIAKVEATAPWTLGELGAGDEWLGAVFNPQAQRDLTADDLDDFFDSGGTVVAEAYDRMAQGADERSHPWMRHYGHEVDVIVKLLGLTPGATVLDMGCGNGRHAVEFATRGFAVTAMDRSEVWLGLARARAKEQGQELQFVHADARGLELGRTFDAVICLFDVVGSFRRDEDNEAIVAAIARYLAPGGRFALSVLSRTVAEAIATLKGDVVANPNLIHAIPPATTMQDTGGIWDPAYFLADTTSGVIYRREQFDIGTALPVEMLVCDRRYMPDELCAVCRRTGLKAEIVRPVRLGRWDEPLQVNDRRATELLCVGLRP